MRWPQLPGEDTATRPHPEPEPDDQPDPEDEPPPRQPYGPANRGHWLRLRWDR